MTNLCIEENEYESSYKKKESSLNFDDSLKIEQKRLENIECEDNCMNSNIFDMLESNVRSYCRSFPDIFAKAKGSVLYSESGEEYLDFFSGAGALNYGHNNEYIKQHILEYIISDGITHGLDMYTKAKQEFMKTFQNKILVPGQYEYKLQFCGPTGTNAVEAALKLARKVKKRTEIFSFMGGFHGMSLGSLSATSSYSSRLGAGIPLNGVTFMPYPHGFMNSFDTIEYIEAIIKDDHSGSEKPAAIIFETVQAEGGVIVAPSEWIKRLADLCKQNDILLICDDIQTGCGRTGTFFSFERAGIEPDMVTLSKSISGYGLPMSLLLLKPELDQWNPGEHNGTFRGNQLAFVGAKAALELREELKLDAAVAKREEFISNYLLNEILPIHPDIKVRGIGMIWGIELQNIGDGGMAQQVVRDCYNNKLIIECAGRNSSVVKLMPALTILEDELARGCEIIKNALIKSLVRQKLR